MDQAEQLRKLVGQQIQHSGSTRVIAVTSGKGGVGKTTTCVNLGIGLARQGRKVLLVDFDPQGNSTSGFGIEKEDLDHCIYDALLNDVPAESLVLDTNCKKVFVIPATIQLAGAEIELVSAIARETRLKDLLEPIQDEFDFIFIDCPPSLGLLTINALTAADSVLIPIQCEYYALEGLSQLIHTVELVKDRLNSKLEIEGVVFTMYDARTNLSLQVVENVKDNLNQNIYKTIIPRNVRLAEAPSYANIIVIAILVIASTLLDFFEEYRSNKAAEKLREIVETTTTVIRDNKEINIPVKNVTLGDIVLLSAGSIIPADLRIIESKDLYVGQASLTGESDNIKKTVELENNQEGLDSISDFDNICFMGTNVVSGSAKGVVIKTADSTYFGKIANTVTSGKEKTAFQKGIESISKLLIRIMIFMIPIVFLINVEKHDIILAFTFAVAIAICITPLLLPVILSSSLSKGAVRMSKKKTIVKKLDSIQNFGAMNIFCTDKTGTLTEDKIVLEKYLNVNGEEDSNILKYAFLNAYLQTGLKSNIDEAVVAKAKTIGIENSVEKYKKIEM